ncbi:MAG: hypothetical protein IPM24_01640 [Bryobacterales bacterium]|nr:hypothetical protein [Bryobacterales bacterium]
MWWFSRFGWLAAAGLLAVAPLPGVEFFPLGDVRAGQRGSGRTVFSGGQVEEFGVEILGVLENAGPRQSLILARLSGGPIERTGVMQGMSGSPVYIDGKLAGAVAMTFAYSKEPIAAIRPIEEMVAATGAARARRFPAGLFDGELLAGLPPPASALFGENRLTDVATPVSFAGFTPATIETFAPKLRALGLEPVQGLAGGGRPRQGSGQPLEPGAMISVMLVTGDLSIAADGTLTHVDGNRIWAFGHRFLAIGPAEMPFARSEVLALLPSVATSFKISQAKEIVGTIVDDRSAAVAGEIGRQAAMVQVALRVAGDGPATRSYAMEMVRDPLLAPFLLQMLIFSAVDATERTSGASSVSIRGTIELDGVRDPVAVDNIYSADAGSAAAAALSTALPLAYVLQSGFQGVFPRRVDLDIRSAPEKRLWQIASALPVRAKVRPGETAAITVELRGDRGAVRTETVHYTVPAGLAAGPLYVTVADAMTINLIELRGLVTTPPRSADHAVSVANRLRGNGNAYVRVWRAQTAYQYNGLDYSAPPASLAALFARAQKLDGALTATYQSKLAEFEIDGGGAAVSGSRTIQMEVTE